MNKFFEDLQFGNKYEKEFINIVKPTNFKIIEGKFKDYDIEITKDDITTYFEIKSDRLTNKTGNICIEYECNKTPSGITTTTADYYIYFEIIDDNNYIMYEIPVKKLKKYIRLNKYHKVVNGGDGYRSKLYLFNKDVFKKYIKVI